MVRRSPPKACVSSHVWPAGTLAEGSGRRHRLVFGLRPRRDIAVVPPRRHDGVVERNGHGDVNIVVCETDYKALKRGIQHLPPAVH